MYGDFIIKQLVEYVTKYLFILTALFFGEKYIIEYVTKKTVDSFIYYANATSNLSKLSYMSFFYIILSSVFYFLIITFCILLIFI